MATLFGQSLSLLLFGAGVVLSIMEALAPGAHLIVLGVALMAAGLIGLLVPSLASPLALGVLVVVTGALAFLVYRRLDLYQGSDTGTTRSSEDLRGARGHVTDQVTGRSGRVELERGGFDSTYAARAFGDDIPVGAEVVVIDPGGGNVVTVEQVTDVDEIDRELEQYREQVDEERERS